MLDNIKWFAKSCTYTYLYFTKYEIDGLLSSISTRSSCNFSSLWRQLRRYVYAARVSKPLWLKIKHRTLLVFARLLSLETGLFKNTWRYWLWISYYRYISECIKVKIIGNGTKNISLLVYKKEQIRVLEYEILQHLRVASFNCRQYTLLNNRCLFLTVCSRTACAHSGAKRSTVKGMLEMYADKGN